MSTNPASHRWMGLTDTGFSSRQIKFQGLCSCGSESDLLMTAGMVSAWYSEHAEASSALYVDDLTSSDEIPGLRPDILADYDGWDRLLAHVVNQDSE